MTVSSSSTPLSPAPRSIARREDELHAALVHSGRIGRREDVLRARAFARVDASKAYYFHGCASVGEYGRRIGFGSRQAVEYAAAGRVLVVHPEAEARLLDGSMCVSTLAVIEPLVTQDQLRLEYPQGHAQAGTSMSNAAIVAWARVRPDRELRRVVRHRREAVRVGGPTTTRTLHLSAQGVDDLDRTQVLAARKEGRAVSHSEAAEHAFRDYVVRHDLLRKKPRKRRCAPMPARRDGKRNPRYVPAEVRRELMRAKNAMDAHGDVCAIELCDHGIWLENSHHVTGHHGHSQDVHGAFKAHADGGGNERADQDRLCVLHHRMKDHGEIEWVPGDARSDDAAAEGYYRTQEGEILRVKASGSPHDPPSHDPPSHDPPSREGPERPNGVPDGVHERAPPMIPSRRDTGRRDTGRRDTGRRDTGRSVSRGCPRRRNPARG